MWRVSIEGGGDDIDVVNQAGVSTGQRTDGSGCDVCIGRLDVHRNEVEVPDDASRRREQTKIVPRADNGEGPQRMAHAVEHAVERAVGAADGCERCHGYHVRTQHVKAVEIVVHGLQCGLVLDDGMVNVIG
ncbi:hypothetical protein G6F65_021617 [Rhizopus arrhizus]|nr:hypothetical protein G6F65_021617 [Rhizopus arrhizus]